MNATETDYVTVDITLSIGTAADRTIDVEFDRATWEQATEEERAAMVREYAMEEFEWSWTAKT